MPAAAGGKLHRFIELRFLYGVLLWNVQPYLIKVVLHRGVFGRSIVDKGAVIVHVLKVCAGRRQMADCAKGVGEIEVLEPVTVVGSVNEDIGSALHKADGVLGLNPGVVVFREDGAHKQSVKRPVLVQPHVVLAAVYNLRIDIP